MGLENAVFQLAKPKLLAAMVGNNKEFGFEIDMPWLNISDLDPFSIPTILACQIGHQEAVTIIP